LEVKRKMHPKEKKNAMKKNKKQNKNKSKAKFCMSLVLS